MQEERRLRTAYENAEGSEREKFALFSAGVRESHEKERTRAERTKNWSVIGSVLGALIGVMGSTYVNRVRLQVRRVDDSSEIHHHLSCNFLSYSTMKKLFCMTHSYDALFVFVIVTIVHFNIYLYNPN